MTSPLVVLLVLSSFIVTDDDVVVSGVDCALTPPCTLTAQPVRSPISIDGHLDEQDWNAAAIATGFRQFEPSEGATPSQRTEVRILYGATALYVGAYLYDDEPEKIMKTLGRRDDFNQADWFTVAIDSHFDRKTAYNFSVNAAGVQVDGILTRRLDTSWDAVWNAAVRTVADGWIVEMRIPYSMLRFAEADVQQWGINFRREIPRFSEISEWSLVKRAELEGGAVAKYGILDGLNNIRPRKNFQVTPYTVSQLTTEEGDPGTLASSRAFDVGGDLKIGLTSNFVLDATINPDFGQVDADPAELNLTAFESFFPERRPFFTEGVQIFEFDIDRGGSLLYTRRIGGRAPIIGATKLSGRTRNGLSVGVLGAFTGDQFDPTRSYGVARLDQEVGENSSIGGIVTAYDQVSAVGTPRHSITGGVDWDLRLKNNRYRLEGQASATRRAEPGSDLTAQTGFSGGLEFEKVHGILRYSTNVRVIDDQFNPNDLGRLRSNNFVNLGGGVTYQVNGNKPFGPIRRATARLFTGNSWSYTDGLNQGLGFFFFSDWQTKGFQEIRVNIRTDYVFGGYDINETRGLGPRQQPYETSFNLNYATDSRRAWQLRPGAGYEWWADGGRSYSVSLGSNWNVSPRVSFSTRLGLNQGNGRTEWASNESFIDLEDGLAIGATSTSPANLDHDEFQLFDDVGGTTSALLEDLTPYDESGAYYVPVFGKRDTRSMDLTLRSNLTFTPTLSLQVYGQLFAARGQYQDFSLLQDRDTLVPIDGYPKRHDFALSSFQTNTVLRWEYRPGSALFLVWTQARRGNASFDAFDLSGRSPFSTPTSTQLIDTFDLFPTNVFLVKLSYKFLR